MREVENPCVEECAITPPPSDPVAIEENARQSNEIMQAAVLQATAVSKKMQERLDISEEESLLAHADSVLEARSRKQRVFGGVLWALPTAFSVWYAAAIFFVPSAHVVAPALLWTPGVTTWVNGTLMCCPKPSLCSEGWAQFWLLVAARLSAFAMYPSLLLVFFSKCHASLRFLSRSFVAELLPFAHLHSMHTVQGVAFASLALLHTFVHLVRWGLRGELAIHCGLWAGMSGLFGMALMLGTTCSMLLPRLQGRLAALGKAPFELRFRVHWLFLPLGFVLCYHAPDGAHARRRVRVDERLRVPDPLLYIPPRRRRVHAPGRWRRPGALEQPAGVPAEQRRVR